VEAYLVVDPLALQVSDLLAQASLDSMVVLLLLVQELLVQQPQEAELDLQQPAEVAWQLLLRQRELA